MATVTADYEERSMSIGRVFQRAFSTIGHNPIVVLGIAAILGAFPSVLMNYVIASSGMSAGAGAANASASTIFGGMAASWIVAVVVGAIVQGALTRAVAADNDGQRAGFGECLSAAVRVLLPLIGVALLFSIAIFLGMLLLIVPGIMIMVAWSVAGPAVVVERNGVGEAFRRSGELTKGSRWKIFGLFLVLLVIYLIAFTLLGVLGVTAAQKAEPTVMSMISGAITAIVMNLLWGTIQPALYLELREARDGVGLTDLEQVFA